jgi:hypothetical protein
MIIFNFLVYSSKIKDRKNALYTLLGTVSKNGKKIENYTRP